jgi:hypothetical protein
MDKDTTSYSQESLVILAFTSRDMGEKVASTKGKLITQTLNQNHPHFEY